jgi:hypothetical protein
MSGVDHEPVIQRKCLNGGKVLKPIIPSSDSAYSLDELKLQQELGRIGKTMLAESTEPVF